jgi:hypothetical protein
MRGDKQKHVAISHLPDTFTVRRSWHRLNGCRSVTGSVPQLLWMSTELIIILRVYHRQLAMSILLWMSRYLRSRCSLFFYPDLKISENGTKLLIQ